MQHKPFSRSIALAAAINQAFIVFNGNRLELQQYIRELTARKEFQSRGHGRSKRSGVNVKALSKMAKHGGDLYTKYVPFGGKQEVARRAARFAQAV